MPVLGLLLGVLVRLIPRLLLAALLLREFRALVLSSRDPSQTHTDGLRRTFTDRAMRWEGWRSTVRQWAVVGLLLASL